MQFGVGLGLMSIVFDQSMICDIYNSTHMPIFGLLSILALNSGQVMALIC